MEARALLDSLPVKFGSSIIPRARPRRAIRPRAPVRPITLLDGHEIPRLSPRAHPNTPSGRDPPWRGFRRTTLASLLRLDCSRRIFPAVFFVQISGRHVIMLLPRARPSGHPGESPEISLWSSNPGSVATPRRAFPAKISDKIGRRTWLFTAGQSPRMGKSDWISQTLLSPRSPHQPRTRRTNHPY